MSRSYPVRATVFILALFALVSTAHAQVVDLRIEKLHEGVYAAIRSTDPVMPSDGNTLIVINTDHVVVVDTNITPASARAVLTEIRALTPLPVRYVINTHHHGDHIYGNGVYRDAFPGVTIIGARGMREEFMSQNPPGKKDFIESSRKTMTEAPARLASGKNEDGTPMTDAQRKALETELDILRRYVPEIENAPLIPPDVTFDSELTLHEGGREIQIRFLGRGNTTGDAIVYLPREKILATGDLVVYPVPFAFDSYPVDWAETMKKLAAIDATAIVPGHGPLMHDKRYVTTVEGLLDSVVTQVRAAIARGLSVEDAQKTVDVSSIAAQFGNGSKPVQNYINKVMVPGLVQQAYKALKGARP